MRSLATVLALALLSFLLAGCDSPPAATTSAVTGSAPPGPPGPPGPPAPPPSEVAAPADEATAAADAPPAVQETERVKAGVGVGIKGRSLDEHEGMVVTPVKTLFSAKERIAFEIEVPHAMQLYLAANLRDRVETHEEFMEQVIKPNGIKLPLLPPGHNYLFDPETQQLMVERPKKSVAP